MSAEAIRVRERAADLARGHAARLGMDPFAAAALVTAIQPISVEAPTNAVPSRADRDRLSYPSGWPRAATPTNLVPIWAGEFKDHADWVNFATHRLTGCYDPFMRTEVKAICVDAVGRRCTMGGHFKRAQDEGAFPVRYFFECEVPA
jgi:hypothetical protein